MLLSPQEEKVPRSSNFRLLGLLLEVSLWSQGASVSVSTPEFNNVLDWSVDYKDGQRVSISNRCPKIKIIYLSARKGWSRWSCHVCCGHCFFTTYAEKAFFHLLMHTDSYETHSPSIVLVPDLRWLPVYILSHTMKLNSHLTYEHLTLLIHQNNLISCATNQERPWG